MSKKTGQRIIITAKEIAKWESIMRKLQNEIDAEEKSRKKKDKNSKNENSV